MSRQVRVTLVSNINHSVYAARALHRLGVLERYLGPVIVDSESRWPGVVAPQLRATRSYQGVTELPLRRMVAAEVTARTARRLPLDRQSVARLNSGLLDRVVSPRLGHPDILHVNTAGLVRSVLRAKRSGALVVADHREVHPRAHTGADPLLTRLERELSAADWVLANSDRSAQSLVEWGVAPGKVVTIPLGVDVARFTSDATAGGDTIGERPARILFVGALIRAKGVDTLIEAVHRLPLVRTTLRLCGRRVDAELAARCEAAADVTVLGPVDRERLVQEYRLADVLVLPSQNDGFGLVAVEALACGTPVVVTTECGVSSLITPEIGRVVPPDDPDALARGIVETVALAKRPMTAQLTRQAAVEASWDAYERRIADWYAGAAIPAALERL